MQQSGDVNHYTRTARVALQTHATIQLLQAFAAAQMPAIVFKGLALRERVYITPEQRVASDVDLLVRRVDWERADALLVSLGYAVSPDEYDWTADFAREFMGETPYRKGAMVIDLHWELTAMSWFRATTAFDLDGLWVRAVPTEIAGAPALRLCPEDEILHLCYHTAVHHGLAHPHGYRDILGVLRVERDNLDWSVLTERARAWRVSVAVWAALKVARGRMQEARSKKQEARSKNQESRIEKRAISDQQPATSNANHTTHNPQPTTHNPEDDLIPEAALDALRVPRWRQRLLQPFVRRAMTGEAALVSGTMRFLGVLLVDRVWDLPGVVLRGLFPGRRWLQLRYDLSPRQAFWRQFTYPLQVLAHGTGAFLRSVIRHS